MRKITQESAAAFVAGRSFSKSNMAVTIHEGTVSFILFGKTIATRIIGENVMSITLCGWNTPTTRERLNGLPDVSVSTRKGVAMLNGVEWDGEFIDVPFNPA